MAFGLWLAAMVYTIAYCHFNGYGRDAESLTFVLWFPDWVFWGVIVPWTVCLLFSLVFAFRIMGDEPLGEEVDNYPAEQTDLPGEVTDA